MSKQKLLMSGDWHRRARTAAEQAPYWARNKVENAARGLTSDELIGAILGQDPRVQQVLKNRVGAIGGAIPGVNPESATRFAARPDVTNILKIVPGLGVVGGTAAVGNLALGEEELANKAMDAAAMLGGGYAGYRAAGRAGMPGRAVLGVSAGALANTASNSLQWLFGDKMSPQEREVQTALSLLKSGVV